MYRIEDGVTQSLLSDFLACRVRCQYVLEGWENNRPRDPLVFGSFFHDLMERLYNEMSHGEAPPPFSKFEKAWQKKEGHRIHDAQKFEAFAAMAEALYAEYVVHWSDDADRDFFEIEGVFDVNWQGYRLRGRRDGVFNVKAKRQRKTKPWLLETKTTAGLAKGTLNERLAFDFQNLFYITAFEIETGEDMAGVLYNVIVKPQIKIGTMKNPTITDYAVAVRNAVANNPDKYFHRFEVVYSKRTKKWFRDELEGALNEFFEWSTGKRRTLHNPQACVTRWSCEFLHACASGSMAGYTQTRKLFRELD